MWSPARTAEPLNDRRFRRRAFPSLPVRRATKRFVGIDISVTEARLATLESTRPRDPFRWSAGTLFSVPVDPTTAPPADWVGRLAERLRERLPRCVEGDHNLAVLSLPTPWVHYETDSATDVASAQQRCDALFSQSLFQSDARVNSWPVGPGEEPWMVAATASAAALEIADAVTSVGYEVEAILPHAVALASAAVPLTSVDADCVAYLDASGGLVAMIADRTCGLARNLPAGEWLARRPGAAIDSAELESWLDDVASEILATRRYAQRCGCAVESASPLLICGPCADVRGIDAALATRLDQPVAIWQYVGAHRPAYINCLDTPRPETDAPLAVALSLALAAAHTTSAGPTS